MLYNVFSPVQLKNFCGDLDQSFQLSWEPYEKKKLHI